MNLSSISTLKNNLEGYDKKEFHKFMPKVVFNYCINISLQSNYIYFETAKVACSSIKKTLKYLEAETTLDARIPLEEIKVHQKDILLSPSSVGLDKFCEIVKDPTFFKFSFVRNPYTRILSAFLDKIARKTKEKRKFTQQFGLDFDKEIKFENFLRLIKDQSSREMNHHWRPQTDQLCWGVIDYQFVGRFENFDADFEKILNKIYPNCNNSNTAIDIKNYQPHKTNASYKIDDFYNYTTRDLVIEIYQKDFQNFNYPIDLPLNPDSEKSQAKIANLNSLKSSKLSSENISEINSVLEDYLQEANKLKQEGKLTQAIDKYSKVLQLHSENITALNQLAEIYESKKELDQAIPYYQCIVRLQPNNSRVYVKLAKALMAQKNTQGAIEAYQKAIALQPEQPAGVYIGLGDALNQNGQIEEAISAYQKAIELKPDKSGIHAKLARAMMAQKNIQGAITSYQKAIELSPNNPDFHLSLGQLYFEKSNWDGLIDSYQKAIKLKPNLPFHIYHQLAQALNLQGRKDEATKVIKSAPQIDFKNGETYLKIWNALNKTSLKTLDEESSYYPTEIARGMVNQYFTQTSQYKIINLRALKEEDKRFIKSVGLSLSYLKLNRAGLITKEGVSLEESISHSAEFQEAEHLNLPLPVAKAFQRTKFQLDMVEEGYIYAICPSTGRILRSNRSFVPGENDAVFYRFVGNEVFYLITGRADQGFSKLCLYFPRTELIVVLWYLLSNREQTFNHFKTHLVTNYERIKAYILNNRKPQKIALVTYPHFAHHLWNELSGIYKLYESNSWYKVDRFLVVSEPLGCIDEIFPEIPSQKIERIRWNEMIEEFLDNNYFCIRFGYNYIKEDLAHRIYQISLKKCSPAFLAEIEKAKQKHFPLFWISIRLGNRTWVSQTEGIANIIKSLSKQFPNLGVVIDGFSLPERRDGLIKPEHEATITKEKAVVRRILSLLTPEIKVYDTVGCMLYESIVWAHAIDLYLAHHGTIQHKVGWTANKPGVVHTNRRTLKTPVSKQSPSWARENVVVPIYIPKHHVRDVTENVEKPLFNKRPNLDNYDCDWRVIYEELLKLALSIKRD